MSPRRPTRDAVELVAQAARARTVGQLSVAVSRLEEALSLDPDCHPAAAALAEAHAAMGAWSRAVDAAELVTGLRPEDPAAWLRLAELLHAAGCVTEAAEVAERVVRGVPSGRDHGEPDRDAADADPSAARPVPPPPNARHTHSPQGAFPPQAARRLRARIAGEAGAAAEVLHWLAPLRERDVKHADPPPTGTPHTDAPLTDAPLTDAPLTDVTLHSQWAAALHLERRYEEAAAAWVAAGEVAKASQDTLLSRLATRARRAAQGRAPLDDLLPLLRGERAREAGVPSDTASPAPRVAPERASRRATTQPATAKAYERGRALLRDGRAEEALEALRGAVDGASSLPALHVEAALRLGMAYEDDRQTRRAVDAYRRCLTLAPDHFQAATNMGEAYRKNEQYLEALTAYGDALAIKPDYLYALAGKGEALRMLGRHEEALEAFEQALEQGPSHVFALQGTAATLNALDRHEEAIPLWRRALELSPRSGFAAEGLAWAEARGQRAGRAYPREERDPAGPTKQGSGPPPTSEPPRAPRDTEDDVTVMDEVPSATPTLDEQGRDLTALARAGRLDVVHGRDAEIHAVLKTLVRRTKANPLLLGDPGVGKTAIVEGVAARLVADDCPPRLRGCRLIELSMGALVAGTKYRGTFEKRLREIVREARETEGIVLFIDELHTLVGAGRTEGGSLDAANLLKPALARGEITLIGATTHEEYRRHIRPDAALERRLQPIDVREPDADTTRALLDAVQSRYEAHHGVTIRPDALDAAVRLSARYLHDRHLPDKALDLVDEAAAEASLRGAAEVTAATVTDVVSARMGRSVAELDAIARARIQHAADELQRTVVGQPRAVGRLAEAITTARAGLRPAGRPRGVYLFAGPAGVGNSALASALADLLFPEGDALLRISLADGGDRGALHRLFGAPPGFPGHEDEGQLTGPLRRRPFRVVLLEDADQASPELLARLIPLLDQGTLLDGGGRTVTAADAFVVLTVTGPPPGRGLGFSAGSDEVEVSARLPAALLQRVDAIIPFHALDADAARALVARELQTLATAAFAQGLDLSWAEEVLDHLARPGAPDGARGLMRRVADAVGVCVARALLRGQRGRARLVLRAGALDLDTDATRTPVPGGSGRRGSQVPQRQAAEGAPTHGQAPAEAPTNPVESA